MTLLKELLKVKARRQNSSWIEISLIFIFALRSRFLFRLLHLVEVIFMEGKRHQLTSVAPCEGAGWGYGMICCFKVDWLFFLLSSGYFLEIG